MKTISLRPGARGLAGGLVRGGPMRVGLMRVGLARVGLALWLGLCAEAAAAEQIAAAAPLAVSTSADISGSTARLVLDWPTKIDFSVSSGPTSVTFDFSVPANVEMAAALRRVGAFVTGAQSGNGGRTLTLRLAKPMVAKAWREGTSIVITLTPEVAQPVAPKPVAPKPVAPQPAPEPEVAKSEAGTGTAAAPEPADEAADDTATDEAADEAALREVAKTKAIEAAAAAKAAKAGKSTKTADQTAAATSPVPAPIDLAPETAAAASAATPAADDSVRALAKTKAVEAAEAAKAAKAAAKAEVAAAPAAEPKPKDKTKAKSDSGVPVVAVTGDSGPDYGRLVFDWQTQVSYNVRHEKGDEVVIAFMRTAKIDVDEVNRSLPKYVRIVKSRIQKGVAVVWMKLAKGARVRAERDGKQVVLFVEQGGVSSASAPGPKEETAPAPAAAEAAAEVAEAAGAEAEDAGEAVAPSAETAIVRATTEDRYPAPKSGPKLTLKSGRDKGYSWLAVTLPSKTGYTVQVEGDEAVIVLDKPARVDLKRLQSKRPRNLESIAAEGTAEGDLVLRVKLTPGVTAHDRMKGRKLIVRFHDPLAPKALAKLLPRTKPGAVALPVDLARELVAGPAAASDEVLALAEPLEFLTARSEETEPAGPADADSAAAAAIPAEPEAAVDADPLSAVAVPAEPEAPAVVAAPTIPVEPADLTAVRISTAPDAAVLRIALPQARTAAAFQRAGQYWVVFDWPVPLELSLVRLAKHPAVGQVRQLDNAAATVLLFSDVGNAAPRLSREGEDWVIEMRAQPPLPNATIPYDAPNGRLVFDVERPGDTVSLTDPEVGDALFVTPVETPGLGIAEGRRWPQFQLLPTIQGVAVAPLSDDLAVLSGLDGVSIEGADGLLVSHTDRTVPAAPAVEAAPIAAVTPDEPEAAPADEAAASEAIDEPVEAPVAEEAAPAVAAEEVAEEEVAAEEVAPEKVAAEEAAAEEDASGEDEAVAAEPDEHEAAIAGAYAAAEPGRLFRLPDWRLGGAATFRDDRRALQDAVTDAPANEQNAARLALARFHFAHGMASEARAVLDLLAEQGEVTDPELVLMRAATALMLGDLKTGETLLADPGLKGESEAEPWRAMLAARQGQWEVAAERFAEAAALLGDYPQAVRTQLRLLGADARIEVADPLGAGEFMEQVAADAPGADARAQLTFLEGKRAARVGSVLEARAIWESLKDSANAESRARALYELTLLQLKDKSITPAEAIERLEQVRYTWRGGELELAAMRQLADLYLGQGQARKGLALLRDAATTFADRPEAGAVAQRMGDAFANLYLRGGADRLSPLTAVALFKEFRELTPLGSKGDQMIAALADRLVKVDLLDEAAALLDDQVKHRLKGIERTRAGTRLAAISLLDRKPDAAVAALRASDMAEMPAALAAERKRLEARARLEKGQGGAALALIAEDRSPEADLLRVDIAWRNQQWAAAAEALQALIAARGETPAELSPEGEQLVLNQAVALSLAGDHAGLDAIRAQFGEKMATGPSGDAFALLTSNLGDAGVLAPVAEQLRGVEQVEGFLATYRKSLQMASLSDGTESAATQ